MPPFDGTSGLSLHLLAALPLWAAAVVVVALIGVFFGQQIVGWSQRVASKRSGE